MFNLNRHAQFLPIVGRIYFQGEGRGGFYHCALRQHGSVRGLAPKRVKPHHRAAKMTVFDANRRFFTKNGAPHFKRGVGFVPRGDVSGLRGAPLLPRGDTFAAGGEVFVPRGAPLLSGGGVFAAGGERSASWGDTFNPRGAPLFLSVAPHGLEMSPLFSSAAPLGMEMSPVDARGTPLAPEVTPPDREFSANGRGAETHFTIQRPLATETAALRARRR